MVKAANEHKPPVSPNAEEVAKAVERDETKRRQEVPKEFVVCSWKARWRARFYMHVR